MNNMREFDRHGTDWGAKWLVMVLVPTLMLLVSVGASALTVVPRSFDELVEQADTIVIATVGALRTGWGSDGQTIFTYASLQELEIIKGEVPAAVFDLPMPGGVLGDQAQFYPGMPQLRSGERYILFMRGYQREFVPLVGIQQGLYRVLRDGSGQVRVVRSDVRLLENSVTGVARAPLTAPSLDSFIAAIQARLSADDSVVQP